MDQQKVIEAQITVDRAEMAKTQARYDAAAANRQAALKHADEKVRHWTDRSIELDAARQKAENLLAKKLAELQAHIDTLEATSARSASRRAKLKGEPTVA